MTQHQQPLKRRDTLLISHANPEDNELALWLTLQLANEGFRVWSDLTKLLGGEVFWDNIEDAIRTSAVKVVLRQFRRRGARVAAIGLGDRTYANFFREETKITFPLLIDDKRQAYRAAGLGSATLLHLLRSDNAVARKRARAGGHRQYKLGKNPFQLGGSFVFAPGNRDLYAHVSKTFGDTASVAELLAVIP